MTLKIVTPPDKIFAYALHMPTHINLEGMTDDAEVFLEDMIQAAVARLDGPTGLLGRALITQQWELTLNAFPHVITLPLPPLQSVDEIKYIDPAGNEQTLPNVTIIGLGSNDPAKIIPADDESWPATKDIAEAIQITFTAGYGDDPDDLPADLRAAIRMDVAHLYENREALIVGQTINTLPMGYDSLIVNHRLMVF